MLQTESLCPAEQDHHRVQLSGGERSGWQRPLAAPRALCLARHGPRARSVWVASTTAEQVRRPAHAHKIPTAVNILRQLPRVGQER
jgi:hypothetical protein